MSRRSDLKALLVADLEELLSSIAADETVEVLPYEPRSVTGGQITVTVTPGPGRPDLWTFVTRIYAPFTDGADGEDRLESVVDLIEDGLPSHWTDLAFDFGWDDRIDTFIGQAAISTPKALGD